MGTGPEGGPTGRGRGIEPQPDEDVDTQLVGLTGLHGVIGMVKLGDPDAGEGQAPAQGASDAAEPPALADCDVPTLKGRGSAAQGGPGPHGRDKLGVVVTALETEQLTEGGTPHDAVDGEAGVALELAQGTGRVVTEDAVHPPGVEPECAQALLEVRHVVTPQHRSPAVEKAVTDPKSGLDQGLPRLQPADPVDAQAPQALEGLDRGARALTEEPVGIDGNARQYGGQTVLYVGDRVAAISDRQWKAYR